MYPHRIRLRGPWDYEPSQPPGPVRRIHMPYRWTEGFTGAAQLGRSFGYPGQIDANERVWLMLDGLTVDASLRLNEQPLQDAVPGHHAVDVTALLGPRNRLEVSVASEKPVVALWDEAALEIRRTAYLEAVQAVRQTDGSVHFSGRVTGMSPGPLDLYVLAAGQTIAYEWITPQPAGQPFQATAVKVAPGAVLRVELIGGSVLWYAVEPTAFYA